MRWNFVFALAVLTAVHGLHAQLPANPGAGTSVATPTADKPLPPINELLLAVEHNEQSSELSRKEYTYHVHIERQDFDGKGAVKKTSTTDMESLTVDGVRVDRTVAKDGKPLTPEEAQKESERIDKEVSKDKERRAKHESKGEPTDSRGDDVLTVARILELGNFTNARREMVDGRSTIVADYAGNPDAKTRNRLEGIVRDLVGTVWIDEQDRILVRSKGHFLNDFKIGGGLVLDIHKGLSFEFRAAKVNNEAWLPVSIDGQGSARYLLLGSINGHLHMTVSDFRKFRTTTTIIPSNRLIGPDGEIVPDTSDPATMPKPPSSPQ